MRLLELSKDPGNNRIAWDYMGSMHFHGIPTFSLLLRSLYNFMKLHKIAVCFLLIYWDTSTCVLDAALELPCVLDPALEQACVLTLRWNERVFKTIPRAQQFVYQRSHIISKVFGHPGHQQIRGTPDALPRGKS